MAVRDGKAIVWWRKKPGVRTLYASAGPDFFPPYICCIPAGKDDGQEIGQFNLLPDHQTFLCVGEFGIGREKFQILHLIPSILPGAKMTCLPEVL